MVASVQAVAAQVRRLQGTGKKAVFTNGCFDILHSGHIDLLRRSRALGDVLVVAINSDASVMQLKGIRPDILVKGADWTANIVGQSEVEAWGGKVVALPLVEGHSTTGIVERVLARYRDAG
jgi:D-beta-D-heptose 7-phosphate kinase/D-beta-D-heptose 1-phosphate adenosyltransferase